MIDLPPPPPAYYHDVLSEKDKLLEYIADRITDYYMVLYEPQYMDRMRALYLAKKMGALKEWGAAIACAYEGYILDSMHHMDAAIELDLDTIDWELDHDAN